MHKQWLPMSLMQERVLNIGQAIHVAEPHSENKNPQSPVHLFMFGGCSGLGGVFWTACLFRRCS